MKSSRPSLHLPIAFLGIAGLAALASCSGAETSATIDPAPEAKGQQAVAEYVMHVQPGKRKVSLHRLSQKTLALESKHGPAILPQAVTDASLSQDDVEGSNGGSTNNNTVELVTSDTNIWINDAVNCGTAASFCADVTLNSFWTKNLNFTYAQVTAVVDATGNPIGGHGPISAGSYIVDAAPSGASGGVGGWLHTSDSLNASQFSGSKTGAMLPWTYNNGGAANGGTRRWVFANPDDADTYVRLKVWGTTTYASHSIVTRTLAFPDGCTVGSGEVQLGVGNASTGILYGKGSPQPLQLNDPMFSVLPFAFTFYGTNYAANSHINFSKWGQVTFGAAASNNPIMPSNQVTMTQTQADGNTTLPRNTQLYQAPRPGAFIWWDTLRWNPGASDSGMCAKRAGSVPNRKIIITWSNVGFSGTGPFVMMSVTLNEGSDEIWMHYGSQTASASWSATTGVQNDTGTAATLVGATIGTFPTNTSKVVLPQP